MGAEAMPDKLTPAQSRLADKYAALYATLGVFVSSRDTYDGVLLMKCAQARAEELIRAARHDKRVYGFLEKVANGSDVGTCIIGHTMMLYAILSHHGRIKGNDQLLAGLGYHEAQVLAPPPGMSQQSSPSQQEAMNGYATANP